MANADHTGHRSRKLALLLPDLHAGGAQQVMLTLAREFVGFGHAVDLVLIRNEGALLASVPRGVVLRPLVPFFPTRGSRLRLAVGALSSLMLYLRSQRPDALLSTLTGTNLVAVLAHLLSGVPMRIVLREASTRANLRGRGYELAVRLLYPRADVLVGVSSAVCADLHSLSGRHRTIVRIPNPVDPAYVLARASDPVLHPWFADAQRPVVLAVGRLTEAKDYPNLLRAFALLRETHPDLRLMILGEGPKRQELEALARDQGLADVVAMPGFAENPHPYLKRASLCVLSSKWEGMPNALLEALALGVRVVSTDCGSGPREILDDGRLGRLVPVGDAKALAAAMAAALGSNKEPPMPSDLSTYAPNIVASHYLDLLLPS